MDKKNRWHGAHHYSNKVNLILLLFLSLAAITIYGSYLGLNKVSESKNDKPIATPSISTTPSPTPTDGVLCTQDAKLCPDGSYVGRTGPRCEFVCPQAKLTSSPTLSPTINTPTCPTKPDCKNGKKPCEIPPCIY